MVMAGHTESEELFSWEDEDEEATSPTPGPKSLANSQEQVPKGATVLSPQPLIGSVLTRKLTVQSGKESAPTSETSEAATSPREGSEDSYDLLSSENVSTTGDSREKHKPGDSEDADSDWE